MAVAEKINVVKEARQRQLIDATIATIGRHGYAGTTLNHVASAAGLSSGIVNFYFKSKDQLLAATLAQLAEEYESLWTSTIAAAGGEAAAGLEAMVEADFHPTICTHDKLVVWFAFWSEAQSRPLYSKSVSELEERYFQQTLSLCKTLVDQGGYSGIDPAAAARGLNALSDGLWADLLLAPESVDAAMAKYVCRMFLATLFPRHIALPPRPAETGDSTAAAMPEPAAVEAAIPAAPVTAQEHRDRLSAGLRRRLAPETALQVEDLAVRIGVDSAVIGEWLEGLAEPSSSELGRLLTELDPGFILEIYGPEVATMQHRFEDRLAAARDEERRGRAALQALGVDAR